MIFEHQYSASMKSALVMRLFVYETMQCESFSNSVSGLVHISSMRELRLWARLGE